jgi:glucan biosynthesis protein
VADQTPITRAAAAIERTIRSHIVPTVAVPNIAAPTHFGATMHDLARAAFDSIDVAELARGIDAEAFKKHAIEARRPLAAIQWAARRKIALDHARAAKVHLTSLPVLAAGDE